jgi:hypothetical protein
VVDFGGGVAMDERKFRGNFFYLFTLKKERIIYK